ncbi:MAG: hypothetical protein MI700_08000 [Balneolales bacterium]|nr:hypothetical protein [Balneolales bacterium]
MFGIEALDVVIGLIFIYLLFSLFVSIVNEIINSLLNLKGRKLYNAFAKFVTEEGLKKLKKDPRFQLLLKGSPKIKQIQIPDKPEEKEDELQLNGSVFPDYVPESLFAEILDDKVENSLTKINATKDELINAYDVVIAQARNSYRKNIQINTFIIGLLITMVFNVDSISIFTELANDPKKAALIADQATQFIAMSDSVDIIKNNTTDLDTLAIQLQTLTEEQIHHISANLGVGWNFQEPGWGFQPLAILGWLITAIALSMGAPFWYENLRRVIDLKNELKK